MKLEEYWKELEAYPYTDTTHQDFLGGGVTGLVFRISDNSVAKIRHWNLTSNPWEYFGMLREFAVMQELFNAGFPVPEPLGLIRTKIKHPFSGNNLAPVMEYLEGDKVSDLGEEEREEASEKIGSITDSIREKGLYPGDEEFLENWIRTDDGLYLVDFADGKPSTIDIQCPDSLEQEAKIRLRSIKNNYERYGEDLLICLYNSGFC